MLQTSSHLYPIKAHFFLYNGAQACYLNYLAVVGRQAGVSASNIGVIFGCAPLVTMFMKPLVGYVADRVQNITTVIIICEILLMVFCWGVFLSPTLFSRSLIHEPYAACPTSFIEQVSTFNNGTECALLCGSETRSISLTNPVSNCNVSCVFDCTSPHSTLSKLGFVTYVLSVIFTFSLGATLYSLSDTACYEALGQSGKHLYGQQRLWGTISWGIASTAIGVMIDVNSSAGRTDFTASVIGFTILIVANIVLLLCTPRFKTPRRSPSFFKDVKLVFQDVTVNVFLFWVLCCGILMGIIWTYGVWFLEDLKASKTLIGVTFSVQSIVVEIPMFFISGYLIHRMGYFGCMYAAFICCAIKLIGYSLLVEPFHAIVIDIAGGAIFPLFYSSLTGFANGAAAPGTSATMQCLFGATFEGLGMATGNFLGGVFIDSYGNRSAFQVFGMTALLCALLCAFTNSENRPRKQIAEH